MQLYVNTLIEWHPPEDVQPFNDDQSSPKVERILYLDISSNEVVVIDIFDRLALPVRRLYSEITQALTLIEAHILETDPYASLLRPEAQIKESDLKRRDEAWNLIKELVAHQDLSFLLSKKIRGTIISELARTSKRAKKDIYKYLRRFWQAGMVKNSLLPAFEKCGGKGKRRSGATTDPNAPKLGRPSMLAKATGHSEGVRITPDIERLFERGIKQLYETPAQLSLTKTFKLIKQRYFNEGFEIIDGNPVPIMPPDEKLPTFRQFSYWYEKAYRKIDRETKSRSGEREYNLNSRALLGDSTQMAFGPGSLYQIDATIGDVYLVNSLDRTKIIGRPVIYFCIDVFSRALTGFNVTLEGPSWLSAMEALDNVMMNKVTFCAEYGITIDEDEWPCQNRPDAILADRAEFIGYNATNLVNTLNIRVQNTAPYRADWKGIIERHFGIANDRIIKFMPGYVPRPKQRGDPDYALKAVLTLDEIRKLLIYYILDYNKNHYMKWYKMDEFMISDQVERYPLDLWNWGIKNRSSHLRTISKEKARLNLLPRKKAYVTSRGIHFAGELYYTCDLALRERWFERARIKGGWKVEVAFETRSVNQIYLPLDNDTRLETCYLTPASKHLYGRDLHDVKGYFHREKQKEIGDRSRIEQSDAKTDARTTQIISEATEKTKAAVAAVGKQSKSSRRRGIRDNRAAERERERTQNAWQLGNSDPAGTTANSVGNVNQLAESKDISEEDYVPPASKVEQIRALRNREWKKDEEE